jgi:hypothetical protein
MAHSIQKGLCKGFQSLKAEANIAVGFLGNHKVTAAVTGIGAGAAFTTACLLCRKESTLAAMIIIAATSMLSYSLSKDNIALPKQIFQHATNDKECFAAGFKQGVKAAVPHNLYLSASMVVLAVRIWARA